MKSFINRPIPRLLRYELLLQGILKETPAGHEDLDTIPAVLEIIKGLGKETEPGVVSAKQKVELWRYNANLVFKPGEYVVCLFLSLSIRTAQVQWQCLVGHGLAQRESIISPHWEVLATTRHGIRMEWVDRTFRFVIR